MGNVNFTARYIDTVGVLKKNVNNQYIPHKVVLAEIEPDNKQDMSALKKICNDWKGNYYCSDIAEMVRSNKNGQKTLVVTDQPKGQVSKILNGEKIIGLANVSYNPYEARVSHIETIPKTISDKYNRVGTSMIEYLKNNTTKVHLYCPSRDIIRKFYLPLGFKSKYPNDESLLNYGQLYWNKNINLFKKLYTYFRYGLTI